METMTCEVCGEPLEMAEMTCSHVEKQARGLRVDDPKILCRRIYYLERVVEELVTEVRSKPRKTHKKRAAKKADDDGSTDQAA